MSLQDIVTNQNIITISPHESLSSALSKLSTSHDAAFLFDKEKKLQGLVNPYHCLIRSSYPGNARVEACLYHPPKVYMDFSIEKTADLFIQSKVHYLPVFDRKEQFMGVISTRGLLGQFRNLPIFNVKIKELLKHKDNQLSFVFEDDSVGKALNLFKMTKHSKLIVVNRDKKLKGILSYYDLISYLVTPKTTEKRGDREGTKINFYHHKVKNYAKTYVLTLSAEHTLQEVIGLILDKRIGSVVIVDEKRNPIGIVTTRDLLRYFIRGHQGKEIEIVSKNLSKQSRQIFGGFFSRFSSWFKKTPKIDRAKVFIKEEKKGGLFKVVLSLIPKRGKPEVIKQEGKNLIKVLTPVNEALKTIKKDEKR